MMTLSLNAIEAMETIIHQAAYPLGLLTHVSGGLLTLGPGERELKFCCNGLLQQELQERQPYRFVCDVNASRAEESASSHQHGWLEQLCRPWPVIWSPDGLFHLRVKPLALAEGVSGWLLECHNENEASRLAMVRHVAEAVNSSLLLDDIFEMLADVLQQYIPYSLARLVILDETHNRVQLTVSFDADGAIESAADDKRFVGTDALTSQLLNQSEPILLKSDSETQLKWGSSLLLRPDTTSAEQQAADALVVSLVNKGLVIGMLSLLRYRSEALAPFSRRDAELVKDVSNQLALALENARFYIQTQAQASREFIINQLTKAISQSLEVESILETAVQALGRVTGASRVSIQYFDTALPLEKLYGSADSPEKTTLEGKVFLYQQPGFVALSSPQPPRELSFWQVEGKAFALRRPQQVSDLSAASPSALPALLNPFVLNDVADAPPVLELQDYFEQNQIRSMVMVPIQLAEGLVGVLTLHQCDTLRAWLQSDMELLLAMAEHLSLALHQAQLFAEIARQKRATEMTLLELQQAQMQLIQSEKMAVIGQFVAGIAHEVNTPLGGMLSNTDTLNQCLQRLEKALSELQEQLPDLNLPKDLDAKRLAMMQNLLAMNQLAGERIKDIVVNLRNFARLDESELKTVDLHEGLDSTLLIMQSSLPAHLALEKHYASDLPMVECFPGLLNQVFMNLIVNAIHAVQDVPTPRLTIETARMLGNDAWVHVSIADNGKGIEEANLKRIFDPGFTTKSQGVGTGLGLALCYRIIEKHGGRIEVSSIPGEGTLFRVSLPISAKVRGNTQP